jgi:hypothetical protein
MAGARATEMTSAIFTGGYHVLTRAIEELEIYLRSRGARAEDLVGMAADQVQTYQQQLDRPDHWKQFAPASSVCAIP